MSTLHGIAPLTKINSLHTAQRTHSAHSTNTRDLLYKKIGEQSKQGWGISIVCDILLSTFNFIVVCKYVTNLF